TTPGEELDWAELHAARTNASEIATAGHRGGVIREDPRRPQESIVVGCMSRGSSRPTEAGRSRRGRSLHSRGGWRRDFDAVSDGTTQRGSPPTDAARYSARRPALLKDGQCSTRIGRRRDDDIGQDLGDVASADDAVARLGTRL